MHMDSNALQMKTCIGVLSKIRYDNLKKNGMAMWILVKNLNKWDEENENFRMARGTNKFYVLQPIQFGGLMKLNIFPLIFVPNLLKIHKLLR